MAYSKPTVPMRIPAYLVEEVRLLPLPDTLTSDTKKLIYVLQAGINSIAWMAHEKSKKQ